MKSTAPNMVATMSSMRAVLYLVLGLVFFSPLPFNDFELDKFRWTTLLARLSNEQFLSHSVHSKENGLAISFTHPVPQGWA